ncbi:hypothetical protein [Caldimonas brevitalea]|nr:hypothetical protein [Caldimonas brevitalea]
MLDTIKNGCEAMGKLLKGDLPGAMKEFGEAMQSAQKSMGGMGGLPGLQLPGKGDDLLMKLLGLDGGGKKAGGAEGGGGVGGGEGGEQGGNPLQALMQGLASIMQALTGMMGGGRG